MKKILILGAGLSASSLIRYLLTNSTTHNWQVRVVDRNRDMLERKLGGHPNGVALVFDALNRDERLPQIAECDLVISMLPARFHSEVAEDCISLKKHLITPSYISQEMHALNQRAVDAGVLIMNEIGVDPGIDHMSAMRIIDELRDKGARITSFKSYCGGLIAPSSDNNPWNYKFTWNPRNVVVAGQGPAAMYIDRQQYKYIPYGQLFKRLDDIAIKGYGKFEGYANRDSLSYRKIYGLESIPTIYRGTLRRVDFCRYWNVLVQLGMTDDTYVLENSAEMTPRGFLNTFLPYRTDIPVEDKLREFCAECGVTEIDKFQWLGLLDDSKVIDLERATPAQILEKILVNKWTLGPDDKDMLVMVHQFEYELAGKRYAIESSMVNIGEDQVFTSMSNTVGLPIAICAKMILTDQIELTGVHLPTMKQVYAPLLNELETFHIQFNEETKEL